MKKSIMGALLACAAAFALCMGLVGCGGGSAGSASGPTTADFAGTWDLAGMTDGDGEAVSDEELEAMSALGLEVYLNLDEDGTMALVLFGEAMEGTWTVEGDTQLSVTIEDESVPVTVDGDELTMESDGSTMTFKKGDAKETPDGSADSESTDLAEALTSAASGEAAATLAAVSGAADFPGTWNAIEMSSDGESMDSTQMDSLRALGMDVFMNLNDDGTFDLFMYAASIPGTWAADGDAAIKLSVEGAEFPVTVADGQFTWQLDDATSVTFAKIEEAKEIPADADLASSLESLAEAVEE